MHKQKESFDFDLYEFLLPDFSCRLLKLIDTTTTMGNCLEPSSTGQRGGRSGGGGGNEIKRGHMLFGGGGGGKKKTPPKSRGGGRTRGKHTI